MANLPPKNLDPTPPLLDAADIFTETVMGRIPLADNISSAGTWTSKTGEGAYVPRPDKSIGWLRLLTFVGLDHMYLRSPITGLFKLLGLVLLLGISIGAPGAAKGFAAPAALWYLWDIAQVWLEKDRVVNYGMSLPFDIGQRIGQGVINPDFTGKKQASHYGQNREFSLYALRVLLGFLGVDALMGKPALFMRKITEFMIFVGIVSGIWNSSFWTQITPLNLLYVIFASLMGAIFAVLVWVPWWAGVSTVVMNPERMMTQGIQYDPETLKVLNYFNTWTEPVGPDTIAGVIYDFGYSNVEPTQLRKDFEVVYQNNKEKVAAGNAAAGNAAAGNAAAGNAATEKAPHVQTNTFLYSLLIGNPITGGLFSLFQTFAPPQAKALGNGAVTLVMAKGECERREIALGEAGKVDTCPIKATVAAGKAAASGLTSLLPAGAGKMLGEGMAGVDAARKAVGQAKGMMDKAKGVVGQVTGAVSQVTGMMDQAKGAVGQVTGMMDQAKGAVSQVTGMMDQAKGAIEQAKGAATKRATEAIEQAKGAATKRATEAIEQAKGAATKRATEAIEQAKGAATKRATEAMGSLTAGGLGHMLGHLQKATTHTQTGGDRTQAQSLSAESKLLGAVTMALIIGGAVKVAVDSLVSE